MPLPCHDSPVNLPQEIRDLILESVPVVDLNAIAQEQYAILERNVGRRLNSMMTPEQLDEFEALLNAKDQDGSLAWLKRNCPTYPEVVADEGRILLHALAVRLHAEGVPVDERHLKAGGS